MTDSPHTSVIDLPGDSQAGSVVRTLGLADEANEAEFLEAVKEIREAQRRAEATAHMVRLR